MNIAKSLKQTSKKQISQYILLDKNEMLVDSCDSLFSTERFRSKPLSHEILFLKNIYASILDMSKDEEIYYPKVEHPIDELPGVYDFSFSKVKIKDEYYILWRIYDYSNVYTDFIRYQQRHNELEIQFQILENQQKRWNRNVTKMQNQLEGLIQLKQLLKHELVHFVNSNPGINKESILNHLLTLIYNTEDFMQLNSNGHKVGGTDS